MRTEEAFNALNIMLAKKDNPDDLTFTDHESLEFNPFKLMFKEMAMLKGMPADKLLFVSI